MNDLIDEYLGTLDLLELNLFRQLFYTASNQQLQTINDRVTQATGKTKELLYEHGVEATLIRQLGNELVLISLYHLLERKLKELISYKLYTHSNTVKNVDKTKLDSLSRMKEHIPDYIKDSYNFKQINLLRILVNCFKHTGVVSKELYRQCPLYGEVGEEITYDNEQSYEKFREAAIALTYELYQHIKSMTD